MESAPDSLLGITIVDDGPMVAAVPEYLSTKDVPLDGLPTVIAGRYQLQGLLGSGGMGTVYRALDRELDEVVALKVLRRTLAQTPELLARFRREVKLARKVTHRNVARTFDIGEHAGDRFLTMEYVEGEALSSMLAHEELSLPRICAIVTDICAGLAASHEAGVLHIDLKPENVICATSGRIVITDFGIARALAEDDSSSGPNSVVGTPAYMAPEHIEGNTTLDARADIYALGCMLFRVLTRRLPWRGTTFLASASARLLNPPPDPRQDDPQIPAAVAAVVLRCTARAREERFASAAEVATALAPFAEVSGSGSRTFLAGSVSIGTPKTLAVLSIANEGAESDDYLALGVTELLIDSVSEMPQLRVRPRAATEQQAALHHPRGVGQALGVDVVVHGTMTRADAVLAITLRMLTVQDGFQLWAHRFETSAEGLPAFAALASARIAHVLATKSGAFVQTSSDPVAVDLHMRGRFILMRSYLGFNEALVLLREAHERAPDDTRIALTYVQALIRRLSLEGPDPVGAEIPRRIAEAAVARRPGSVAGRVAKGLIHFEEGEYRSAALELREALRLDPEDPDALQWTGRLLCEAGRPEAAIAHFMRARTSSSSSLVGAALARCYIALGDWEAAFSTVRGPTFERSDASLYWVLIARLVLWRGDRALAAKELARMETHTLEAASRDRAEGILRLASEGTLPSTFVESTATRASASLTRRNAFNTQIEMEILLGAGRVDEARARLVRLDDQLFFDLSWLDTCPLVQPLFETPEFTALRRSTVLRVSRALEVFDTPSG